jgi:anti-sigma factor RsiW
MILDHIDEWGEKAVDYLDGRLDSAETAAVEQHLADCPACASRMSAQRKVVEFLRSSEEASPPDDLENRVLGQFPREAPVGESPARRKAGAPSLWRRFRPWIPVTACVLAVFAGMVAYGLVHESHSSGRQVTANLPKHGAVQTTALNTQMRSSTDDSKGSSSGANGRKQTGTTAPAINDKNSMVSAMKLATQPVFVSFQAPSANSATVSPTTTTASSPDSSGASLNQAGSADQTATTATTVQSVTTATLSTDEVQSLVSQLGDLTGLTQLSSDQSVGGPTFAFYVSKDQLGPLLDLLYRIKNSEDVDLTLRTEPDASYAANVGTIVRRKAELPVLEAEGIPQPAASQYRFTTSTLAPTDDGLSLSSAKTPDSDGSHVLVVVSIDN